MGWTPVTNSGANFESAGPDTTIVLTLGAAVAVNDIIVGFAAWGTDATDITGASDNLGNSYSLLGSTVTDTDNINRSRMFFSKVTVAGTPTITVSLGASTGDRKLVAAAWSGGAASPSDGITGQHQSNVSGTNAAFSGNITPTANGALIVGCFFTGSGGPTVAAGTNFTFTPGARTGTSDDAVMEDLVQATAAAIQATFSISGGSSYPNTHVAAFEVATAVASLLPRRDPMAHVLVR